MHTRGLGSTQLEHYTRESVPRYTLRGEVPRTGYNSTHTPSTHSERNRSPSTSPHAAEPPTIAGSSI